VSGTLPIRARPPVADSVRSRLVRLSLLLLLPALSVAGLVTWRGFVSERADAANNLRDGVQWLGDGLDSRLAETEGKLRLLAQAAALQRGEAAAFFPLAKAAATQGLNLAMWDGDGRVIFDTRTPSAGAELPPTAEPNGLSWSGAPGQGQTLCLSVPVVADGATPFRLAAFMPATALETMLAESRTPAGWVAAVIDPQGRLVARSSPLNTMLGAVVPPPVAASLQGAVPQTGYASALDGHEVLFAAGLSRRYHVGVVMLAPLDIIAQPSRLSLFLLAGEGGLLIILTLLGAARVARSINQPIEALAVATRSLGEDGPVPPVPGGLIEVDQVAASLRAAHATLRERRAALADMNATLAARVAARTTELAEANRALADQREQLGLVLDHMPIGVLVNRSDRSVLYANPQTRKLLGVGDGPMTSALPPMLRRNGEPIDLDDAPPARARRGMVIERELYTVERVDGSRFELEVSAGPVRDSTGRVVLSVTTLADVSDRLAAEEARRRSQRLEAVGQLTGGVAHEFNNLLMAIGGCLDLLSPHVRGDRSRGLLDSAARATDRGARLTRQLLAFARRQHLQAEPIDLNALVTGLTELLASTLGRTIEVVTDLAAGAWPAMADGPQLELVLLNLAINARDAMPGGGRLLIGTANVTMGAARRAEEPPAGDFVRLSVTDTGTGMPQDVLARVFEPFFTTKDVGRGSGLGLPQVLGVAQELGGGVIIESLQGHGTTVNVYLPRAATAPAPVMRRVAPPVVNRALEGVDLVLVDDNDEVREVAREMLEELGASVFEAASGAEALAYLREGGSATLVLADYTMPQMTGVELSREVAKLRPGLPMVLMTGYSTSRVGDAGPYIKAVLQKPFRAEPLLAALQGALGRTEKETAPI